MGSNKNRTYTDLEIEILLGLDDMAHNRLYSMVGDGEFVQVSNYGRRNPDAKCYCKLLKRLGITRGHH